MIAKESFRRSAAHTTSACKIMELVGRFTAKNQWSVESASICYKISEQLHSDLFSEQCNILDELHQRITFARFEDKKLHDVMGFWERPHEYREKTGQRMIQNNMIQSVTPTQASRMLDDFNSGQLWHELTLQQQRTNLGKQLQCTTAQESWMDTCS